MMRIVRATLLVVIWLGLWGGASIANVLSGVVVAFGVVVVFDTWRPGSVAIRPIAATRFFLHFLVELVGASVVVAITVIAPRRRINTGIVAVPLMACSDAIATLIADAISLTPGTLTLEVRQDPLTLFVHVLDVRDVEQVRADVRRLEILAVKAFGDAAALAGLAVDDSTSWRAR